jgi:3-oxocholest-4-en-26-oate---CoA ligase
MSATSFNLADLWEQAADLVPDREALVCGDRRLTYRELEARSNRMAHHLRSLGVGPGDWVALYLPNCTEYLEAMIGCFKIRAVPVNVNYRYVANELRHVLADSGAVGVLHPATQAAVVDEVRSDLPALRWAQAVGDELDASLAEVSADRPDGGDRSGDDLYVMYTGGTTGLPKGVVWRQEDAFFACIGGGDPTRLQGEVSTPTELRDRLMEGITYLPLAPLMHAAAQWTSFMWFYAGCKVVLMPGSLDPEWVWSTVERERVSLMTVVGDAVAKPLLDHWDAHPGRWDVSSLYSISNGGAPMSPGCKSRILERFPAAMVNDGFGSSEAGIQGTARRTAGDEPGSGATTRFSVGGSKPTLVVDDDDRPVEPGSGVVGRILTGGRLPLGYHNDPERTAATFLDLDGRRWLITGDLATVAEDGTIELLGRGSVSINTGGEKVQPEEVEGVLHGHPAVADVLVVGTPDDRWGSAVTAVVQPTPGASPSLDELASFSRSQIAGYKVPKRLVLVDRIQRSPAGKADYPWAQRVAAESATPA